MKDNSTPAFPRTYNADGHNGMTLRDYFAGQALAGMSVGSDSTLSEYDFQKGHHVTRANWYGRAAYRVADAMLKYREE